MSQHCLRILLLLLRLHIVPAVAPAMTMKGEAAAKHHARTCKIRFGFVHNMELISR
jgi:hypothetical protein